MWAPTPLRPSSSRSRALRGDRCTAGARWRLLFSWRLWKSLPALFGDLRHRSSDLFDLSPDYDAIVTSPCQPHDKIPSSPCPNGRFAPLILTGNFCLRFRSRPVVEGRESRLSSNLDLRFRPWVAPPPTPTAIVEYVTQYVTVPSFYLLIAIGACGGARVVDNTNVLPQQHSPMRSKLLAQILGWRSTVGMQYVNALAGHLGSRALARL